MVQNGCASLRKGQLVYYPLDNMIGMIIDINETYNNVDTSIKVEWFIDNKVVIGNISERVAISRRTDYLNNFL